MFKWYCPLNYDIELGKKTEVITYYILGQIYYILRYFGLLRFASKVITFWVTEFITIYVESYYILGHYSILRQKLLHLRLLLHFASIITFCGVTGFSLFPCNLTVPRGNWCGKIGYERRS